jgi:hypothetical protein
MLVVIAGTDKQRLGCSKIPLKWLIKWRNTKQSKYFSAQSITVDCDSLRTTYINFMHSKKTKNRYAVRTRCMPSKPSLKTDQRSARPKIRGLTDPFDPQILGRAKRKSVFRLIKTMKPYDTEYYTGAGCSKLG